jgi:hypothetical protein
MMDNDKAPQNEITTRRTDQAAKLLSFFLRRVCAGAPQVYNPFENVKPEGSALPGCECCKKDAQHFNRKIRLVVWIWRCNTKVAANYRKAKGLTLARE